jgi:hypothetical protein
MNFGVIGKSVYNYIKALIIKLPKHSIFFSVFQGEKHCLTRFCRVYCLSFYFIKIKLLEWKSK